MSSGQWLTYEDAAKLLGMTPDSLRHRASRECWNKQINNQGKAIVLVPSSAIPGPNSAPPKPLPPRTKPAKADLIVEHLARIAEFGAKMDDLRAVLDGANQSERERADRFASEAADLARQFATAMAEFQAKMDSERARADAAEKEARLLKEKWLEAEHSVLKADDFVQAPWWRRPTMKRPARLLGMFTPLSSIKARARKAA